MLVAMVTRTDRVCGLGGFARMLAAMATRSGCVRGLGGAQIGRESKTAATTTGRGEEREKTVDVGHRYSRHRVGDRWGSMGEGYRRRLLVMQMKRSRR
jgi:hypothetical protein